MGSVWFFVFLPFFFFAGSTFQKACAVTFWKLSLCDVTQGTHTSSALFFCSTSEHVEGLTQDFEQEANILTGGFKQSAKFAASRTSMELFGDN